jgi:hypothetical protein
MANPSSLTKPEEPAVVTAYPDKGFDDWVDPGDLDQGIQARKRALFAKAYPWIMRQLARQVPHGKVRAALETQGLKLSPVRFKQLCDEEARARDERGERTCCAHCGSLLPLGAVDASPELESGTDDQAEYSGEVTPT